MTIPYPSFGKKLPEVGNNEFFVMLEDSRNTEGAGPSYLFTEAEEVVSCSTPADIDTALKRIEEGVKKGAHAAGWLAYELGYHLEPRLSKLSSPTPNAPPLLMFGLFRTRTELTREQCEEFVAKQERLGKTGFALRDPKLNMTREEYVSRINKIHEHILDGDTYQVNFTQKYHFINEGNYASLYRRLRTRQPTEFSALINAGTFRILSFSPELFFRSDGDIVTCRPMKGTAPRGGSAESDDDMRRWLRSDPKNRAENLIIVDLLRNDLSRLSKPASIKVDNMFHIETYETLLQMTSTVSGETKKGFSFSELVRTMFPCGSITGAPKIRTMEIINNLEIEPRGIYTGSVGFISPDGASCFNVAIRTLVLDSDGAGEMGVGSGIILDSDPNSEFDECMLKAKFMTDLAEGMPAQVAAV